MNSGKSFFNISISSPRDTHLASKCLFSEALRGCDTLVVLSPSPKHRQTEKKTKNPSTSVLRILAPITRIPGTFQHRSRQVLGR